MADSITVSGTIATDPRHVTVDGDVDITSFRLASPQRYWDRKRAAFVEGETNWFTVTAFRQLAANASRSLHKGERVIVRGRLRVRSWTDGDKSGRTVEIEADALGHDLLWGTTVYTRVAKPGPGGEGATAATAGLDGRTAGAGEDPAVQDTAEPAQAPAEEDELAPAF